MPELPEVETIRRGLKTLIVGKTVVQAHNYASPKSFPNAHADVARFLLGAKVTAVRRRAKVLMIDFSSSYTLVCHLKMTGQIVVISHKERWGAGHPSDSFARELPDNTTREHLDFSDGTRLFFNDLRKFGWMKLYPSSEVPNIDFMQKVGPEPLDKSFTGSVLYERLQRRKNTAIKAAILDQTVLAGVGNIYADESLWLAKLHPSTLVQNVSKQQVTALASAIKSVMRLSIAKGGSTDKNYVNAEGEKGSYLSFAKVFRRTGQPCLRCGTAIAKLRVAGRGTHICPQCQKKR
ncbi:DNA-formamidopyrimidine glycosylase [Candidatus Saccharibacteria bacterium]|nr:MAG: DNA-formamidopyrimidine glycosylase [Candidatus Saccharibacteria bacterium]PID98927.1 MAG: DNA-formamidopyrimidine glycosylase [Candidatus Saccharibacteria bacterium]